MKTRVYLILAGIICGFGFIRCISTGNIPQAGCTSGTPGTDYTLSPFTHLFISELEQTVPVNQIPDTFVPSPVFCRKYGIIPLTGKQYGICGFIKYTSSFPKEEIRQKGIDIPETAGGMSTLCIPLSELYFFLHQKGITYFAISTPAASGSGSI